MRLHPSIAETYRTRVADLAHALEKPARAGEARDTLRALIDKVVLTPVKGALLQKSSSRRASPFRR